MPPLDLKRVSLGQRLQDPLLVLEIGQRESAGGAFTTLTLANCHGRLPTAPFWEEDQPRIAGIAVGDVVQVIAEVGQYGSRRQLKVTSIRVLPKASVGWRQLMPSVGEVTPYWNTLDRWRSQLTRPRLRHILALFFDDAEFRQRYQECPASTLGHHALLGGLLQHTCEVAAVGRAIAQVCRADPEMVLAGALLHDIGKLEAYSWDGVFAVTECGVLLGHVTLGMLMLDGGGTPHPLHRAGAHPAAPPHRVASRQGRVRRHGSAHDPRSGSPLLRRQRQRQDREQGRSPDRSRQFPGEPRLSARSLWQLDRRRAYRGASDGGPQQRRRAGGTNRAGGRRVRSTTAPSSRSDHWRACPIALPKTCPCKNGTAA